MSDFACGGCDYSTAELKDGMDHAATTGHALSREANEEGTTMTISVAYDDDYDEDDDWNAEDQW
jgi:hypothetical protein